MLCRFSAGEGWLQLASLARCRLRRLRPADTHPAELADVDQPLVAVAQRQQQLRGLHDIRQRARIADWRESIHCV